MEIKGPSRPVDTLNKFVVAVGAEGIAILNPPIQARGGLTLVTNPEPGTYDVAMPQWPAVSPLSPDEALNLAAWLVAVVGDRERFDEVLDAVLST